MSATNPQPQRPRKPAAGATAPRPAAKKPAPKSAQTAGGDSLLGWLGRQFGHVKKAVQTDVTRPAKPAAKKQPAPAPRPAPASPRPAAQAAASPSPAPAPAGGAKAEPVSKVVYRTDKIEEADVPDQPGLKFRRTIIDEVIVEKDEE